MNLSYSAGNRNIILSINNILYAIICFRIIFKFRVVDTYTINTSIKSDCKKWFWWEVTLALPKNYKIFLNVVKVSYSSNVIGIILKMQVYIFGTV